MKNYFLKFDKIQGDYVIATKKSQNEQKVNKKISIFNMFGNKNQSISEKSHQTSTGEGFFTCLDKEIEQTLADKKILAKELVKLDKENIEKNTQNDETPSPEQNEQVILPNYENFTTEATSLLIKIYNDIRSLNYIYQNLREINSDNYEVFNSFINSNIEILSSFLNIYKEVNNQKSIPNTPPQIPSLPADFDGALQIALKQIQTVKEDILKLEKMFSVQEFNRQFDLAQKTLTSQNDKIMNIKLQNI